MKNIRIVQYGCGKMATYTMKYIIEKEGIIVGAVDINPNLIGKDISHIIGGDNIGTIIVSPANAEKMLLDTKPDICIIMTTSLMKEVQDALLLCAKLGINAITTCEEAFYPFNSSPRLTAKIDKLAKANNCTITGSGYQDAFWGNLVSTLAGATQKIEKIQGSSSYNVEDYGIALAQAHGAGLTLDAFKANIAKYDNISSEQRKILIENDQFLPSYMWNTSGWLCDKLGLTIISQDQKCLPITCSEDINSETLNITIKKGMVTGMSAFVTTITKEGITLEIECIGKVYSKKDCNCNNWIIIGEPNTNFIVQKPSTAMLTCATVVNRIPDVLKAEKGFIPTSRMGELKFQK